jgi:hypothetical protein
VPDRSDALPFAREGIGIRRNLPRSQQDYWRATSGEPREAV